MREFVVYILASRSHRLYIGVTGHLVRRIGQHRRGEVTFTARYRVTRLVHVEVFDRAITAIAREKQLKGWLRAKKIALIESDNPAWRDLAEGWRDTVDSS